MKSVEERLKRLPELAESTGLQADEQLKRKILRAAQAKQGRAGGFALRRLAPALCALVILAGAAAYFVPRIGGQKEAPLLTSQPAGQVQVGEKLAWDVPQGSISIKASKNPSYRSIWAPASGGNFPLVGVKGSYYRLLTNPTAISDDLLGEALGTVDTFTSEPALAGTGGICSNTAAQGETVYAVRGMQGALAAAKVDGKMRVFQRVSFGDWALMGRETLADTLRADSAVALELSGMGTVNDPAEARRLIGILTDNAQFLRSGGGESNQSLLIQLENGVVIQMAVNGERLIACGTWACPEFFEAYQEALQ